MSIGGVSVSKVVDHLDDEVVPLGQDDDVGASHGSCQLQTG
jgi:hypothetical protein